MLQNNNVYKHDTNLQGKGEYGTVLFWRAAHPAEVVIPRINALIVYFCKYKQVILTPGDPEAPGVLKC